MTRDRDEREDALSELPEAGELEQWVPHLEELRRRIIVLLVFFTLATVGAFCASERIAAFLTTPVKHIGAALYTFAPTEKFMAYLHLSVWIGVAATLPLFCLQALLFIWPALRGREYRYAAFVLIVAPILFVAGAAVCYTFFSPVILGFFVSFASGDGVQQMWGFREYLSLLFGIMFATGSLLLLPLFLLVAILVGLVSPARVAALRPYIILFIFTLSAILTPPEVVTQVMLGVPIYLLFELALFLGKIFRGKKES